ncbi:MBL fold metallo-hydrolase [uncultured Chitinophaga sp.]|uniref:MBL fold metallo-hydrolase n=1 Tax=uncultured Chitinophaga sp. TaxID=339340 RepID=UPI0025DA2750|nr:MBL fold metallo-hydrolase [uncultured Chitinophaga sp.]
MKHSIRIFNPDLPIMRLPFEWKGNLLEGHGRFVNHEHPFNDSFLEVLKWQFMRNPQKAEKTGDNWRLQPQRTDFLTSGNDCMVWLGHASFFIRLAGVTMLIDPVLFNVSVKKRLCALPAAAEDFKGIDYILVSHDHRDHCDAGSLKLLAQLNPEAMYLTGLRMKTLLHSLTGSNRIQEAGWYQEYRTPEQLNVYYMPTRHWGRRGISDTNKRLWGGYIIQGAGKTIYFGGDSGFGHHFTDLATIFPDIDYAILGIGAYKPEFFMSQAHMSPTDALQAFKNTAAKKMIPMHYGTFDLSDEPVGDPLRVLQQAGNKDVLAVEPGEIVQL